MAKKTNFKQLVIKKIRQRNKHRRRVKRGLSKLSPSSFITFPNNKVVKMSYHETRNFQVTAGVTTPLTYLYRANGLYDPRFSVGGHQPFGVNQWSQFYNHYVVLGSRCRFTIGGTENALPLDICHAVSYISDDDTIPASMDTLIESGRGTHAVIKAYNAMDLKNLYSKYSAKRFFNVKDVKDNLDRLGASFGADPSEAVYHSISVQNIGTSAEATSLTVLIKIDYFVLLSEPKDIDGS